MVLQSARLVRQKYVVRKSLTRILDSWRTNSLMEQLRTFWQRSLTLRRFWGKTPQRPLQDGHFPGKLVLTTHTFLGSWSQEARPHTRAARFVKGTLRKSFFLQKSRPSILCEKLVWQGNVTKTVFATFYLTWSRKL